MKLEMRQTTVVAEMKVGEELQQQHTCRLQLQRKKPKSQPNGC